MIEIVKSKKNNNNHYKYQIQNLKNNKKKDGICENCH